MSNYDELILSCKECHNKVRFQTKVGGNCDWASYYQDHAPQEMMADILGDNATCAECKINWTVVKSEDEGIFIELERTFSE